jgi:hypothetical protein
MCGASRLLRGIHEQAVFCMHAYIALRFLQAFEAWFKMLHNRESYFRRVYDKKLCALGLVCVVALPAEALPAPIVSSLPLVRPMLAAQVYLVQTMSSSVLAPVTSFV